MPVVGALSDTWASSDTLRDVLVANGVVVEGDVRRVFSREHRDVLARSESPFRVQSHVEVFIEAGGLSASGESGRPPKVSNVENRIGNRRRELDRHRGHVRAVNIRVRRYRIDGIVWSTEAAMPIPHNTLGRGDRTRGECGERVIQACLVITVGGDIGARVPAVVAVLVIDAPPSTGVSLHAVVERIRNRGLVVHVRDVKGRRHVRVGERERAGPSAV